MKNDSFVFTVRKKTKMSNIEYPASIYLWIRNIDTVLLGDTPARLVLGMSDGAERRKNCEAADRANIY